MTKIENAQTSGNIIFPCKNMRGNCKLEHVQLAEQWTKK